MHAVRVAERQDRQAETRQLLDFAVLDATRLQLRGGVIEVGAAGHREADVVEPDALGGAEQVAQALGPAAGAPAVS